MGALVSVVPYCAEEGSELTNEIDLFASLGDEYAAEVIFSALALVASRHRAVPRYQRECHTCHSLPAFPGLVLRSADVSLACAECQGGTVARTHATAGRSESAGAIRPGCCERLAQWCCSVGHEGTLALGWSIDQARGPLLS